MTSLELFPPVGNNYAEPPEWGTGNMQDKNAHLWTPKPPTWHCTGEPREQKYVLTDLNLSNVRMSDQLLPRPQDCEMQKVMIKKPFPAEHPYTSHMSQFAVFPKFDSAADPKRGAAARRQMPKDAEMPSNPYDITIVQKTKGFGYRHEKQALPSESRKMPLLWNEGDGFDQVIKTPTNDHHKYYPIPSKMYVPNLKDRTDSSCIKGNMKVNERTGNAMRNVERDQWTTTYDRTNTGLGPQNPNKLDNYEDKLNENARTGQFSEQLTPRSIRTFDPSRPFEGRLARYFTEIPEAQQGYTNPQQDPNYVPKRTLAENEEHRLWNGKEYINLPEGVYSDLQWKKLQCRATHEAGLAQLLGFKGPIEPYPFIPAGDPNDEEKEEIEIEKLRREQYLKHQQIEAENRFKELELQKPYHNVIARKNKTDLTNIKSKPDVFYNHEGKYQRERAGLYNTAYRPENFQQQMADAEKDTSATKFDISECHKDSLNLDKELNGDMHMLMREGRTLGIPGAVAQLHNQPTPFEAVEPFNDRKAKQTAVLTPRLETSDVRTQEGGVTLTESEMGSRYNTPKFLQENVLDKHARQEPLMLMSAENQNLDNVRQMTATREDLRQATAPRTGRSVQFSENITVATGANDEPLRMQSAPLGDPKATWPLGSRPETSPMFSKGEAIPPIRSTVNTRETSATPDILHFPVPLEKSRRPRPSPYYNNDRYLEQVASNIAPTNLRHSWAGESLTRASTTLDLSYKNDSRFDWKPGCGTPRPQTTLLDVQNSFSRSDARKRFHSTFSETNPDLRENILRGKRHVFGGMNAQQLRGTPVVV